MWMVNPRIMCRQHLLGEHRELHAIAGMIRKRGALTASREFVEARLMHERHAEIEIEMRRREYLPRVVFPSVDPIDFGSVDREASLRELTRRCPRCRARALYWLDRGEHPLSLVKAGDQVASMPAVGL